MLYLASSSRSDIIFAIHQCIRLCSYPKKSYKEAAKRIGYYLKRTKDKQINYTFEQTKGIEVYVDADIT